MPHKTEILNTIGLFCGASAATGPTFASHFWQTPGWLGFVSVLGVVVLVITGISGLVSIRKNLSPGKQNEID